MIASRIGPGSGSTPTAPSAGKPAKFGEKPVDGTELSDSERREVHELKERDRKVRAHETAHQAAGGGTRGRSLIRV